MINKGSYPVLGVKIHAVDYDFAVASVAHAAQIGRACAVSALAVHGVMTGFQDTTHRRRLNGLDMAVPDGQPVRWALQWVHGVTLPDRVYGPTLMLRVVEEAARRSLPVYFYGSTPQTLHRLQDRLQRQFPGLVIAGAEPSKFRRISPDEKRAVIARINDSGAKIVFVGLGCPRQESWAFEYREALQRPILAVGAAFDFHAGMLSQAPPWMQQRGLEWLYRLTQEPSRLWRRYLLLNPVYLAGIGLEAVSLKRTAALTPEGGIAEQHFG